MKTFRSLLLVMALLIPHFLFSQDINPATPGNIAREGHPVTLKNDTLFHIYAPLGPFTAEERARAMTSRLKEITQELDFEEDSIIYSPVEEDFHILYKDRIMMVIGRKDTVGTGQSMEEIAATVVNTLKTEMSARNKKINVWRILTNIGLTLMVIGILGGIIWALNRFFRWIRRWVDKNRERIFRSIKLNNYEFLTVDREYTISLFILRIIKIFLIVVSFLIALPVIFSIFPATEGVTRKIIQLIWGPVKDILLAVVNYIPELITIAVIYFIFRYLIRFIRFLSLEVERKSLVLPGFHPEWAKPTYNIIRLLLYAFMFVVIFPYLPGSESPVFRGVSVFLGVLISLGSTSLISNAMAGIVITYMRPYKIGDRIKIDDVVGDVTEKTMMITRVRTIKNEDVTIPNAKVLTGYTVNYSTPTEDKEGLIIHTTVTIGYDAPWRQVHGLLIAAAEATEGVSKAPRPFVLQTSLDDFYISYQVNAFIKNPHIVLKIKSDLHQNIQDEFNRAGVEIMSPHYRSERDGNELTIPKDWEPVRPDDLKKEPENKDKKIKKGHRE